jgi:hypothetical protein
LLQKLAGVELGELLAFGDAIVDVGIHFERDARKLAADGDFVRRLQIAGGGDAEEDIATRERVGHIERHLLFGLFDAAAPIPSAQAERDDDEAEDGVAFEVPLGSAGLDGFGEIGWGQWRGGFHVKRVTNLRRGPGRVARRHWRSARRW